MNQQHAHVIKHSVKLSFCFPDSIDAVYHHNNVFSVSLFPFALSAFLKKMVENLMDVSCEEQVGLVGASGICGGNDIISNHMPWHQSEPCF